MKRGRVVILGGENGALPILRSLAMGGVTECIVASERADDPSFHSRYCAGKTVLKRFDPSTDEHNLNLLRTVSASLPVPPVLFWGSDREILFINRNREELSHSFLFLFPDPDLVQNLVEKDRFSRFAAGAGICVPRTHTFEGTDSLLDQRFTVPYPCTIKPACAFDWDAPSIRKTFGTYKHALRRIDSPASLEAYVRSLGDIAPRMVLQEFVPGEDHELVSCHGVFNEAGEPLGCFLGRKIRTSPITFGGSAYIETVRIPGLMDHCIDLCRRINLRGIVKIDMKWNVEEGRYYLLECNLRFNLWEYLGAYAGVNLPRMWYDELTGVERHIPLLDYTSGVRWLYLAGDLRAVPSYLRGGEWTLARWIRSYRAPKVYHTFDWRDPQPILYSLPRFLKRKGRRWSGRLSGQPVPSYTVESGP